MLLLRVFLLSLWGVSEFDFLKQSFCTIFFKVHKALSIFKWPTSMKMLHFQ